MAQDLSVVLSLSEKCDFCRTNPVEGFVDVKTLTGVKTKGACALCAQVRRLKLVSHEEIEAARYERNMVAPLRPFISRLEDDEPTENSVPGVSETQAEFTCQAQKCVCDGRSFPWADIKSCGLKFAVIPNVKRADALRVTRSFVACPDFFEIYAKETGEKLILLPLGECDIFVESEPPLTHGVGKTNGSPPKLAVPAMAPVPSMPAALSPTPPPKPAAVRVACSKNTELVGDPIETVQTVRQIWARKLTTISSVDEALEYARAEIGKLVGIHRPGITVDWEQFGPQTVHKMYGFTCGLHGMSFGKLIGMHHSLYSWRQNLISRGSKNPAPSAKYICPQCQRPVGSLYVGDQTVGVQGGPEPTDPEARCKPCKKKEKDAARRVAAEQRETDRRLADRARSEAMGCGKKGSNGGGGKKKGGGKK